MPIRPEGHPLVIQLNVHLKTYNNTFLPSSDAYNFFKSGYKLILMLYANMSCSSSSYTLPFLNHAFVGTMCKKCVKVIADGAHTCPI